MIFDEHNRAPAWVPRLDTVLNEARHSNLAEDVDPVSVQSAGHYLSACKWLIRGGFRISSESAFKFLSGLSTPLEARRQAKSHRAKGLERFSGTVSGADV